MDDFTLYAADTTATFTATTKVAVKLTHYNFAYMKGGRFTLNKIIGSKTYRLISPTNSTPYSDNPYTFQYPYTIVLEIGDSIQLICTDTWDGAWVHGYTIDVE